jgi:prepilin-type processing-associated H-X9-DG protein
MICSRRWRPSTRRVGFTLVELLVIIGIIAVLAAMLMPALRRVREQANAAVCASNLGQIGKAFLMYAQQNGDRFPYHADWSKANKEDWIHWWAGPGRDPNNLTKTSAIASYLGNFHESLFHCPADEVSQHPRSDMSKGVYKFSYSMNGLFASNPRDMTLKPPPPPPPRVTSTLSPARKMLVIEEDEISLDDGHFMVWPAGFNGGYENFLGTRHTYPRLRKPGTFQGPNVDTRKDRNERGNVVFADGHVELVTRRFTWTSQATDPTQP